MVAEIWRVFKGGLDLGWVRCPFTFEKCPFCVVKPPPLCLSVDAPEGYLRLAENDVEMRPYVNKIVKNIEAHCSYTIVSYFLNMCM